MYQKEEKQLNATTYTYQVASLNQAEMLGYIVDILEDDDITSHGVIITEAHPDHTWTGIPLELPSLPVKEVFVKTYEKRAFVSMTAIMEYHGKTIMMAYRPQEQTITMILPTESNLSIDEIEKNVIPDAIDHQPA